MGRVPPARLEQACRRAWNARARATEAEVAGARRQRDWDEAEPHRQAAFRRAFQMIDDQTPAGDALDERTKKAVRDSIDEDQGGAGVRATRRSG
jgi:hypothetical protein